MNTAAALEERKLEIEERAEEKRKNWGGEISSASKNGGTIHLTAARVDAGHVNKSDNTRRHGAIVRKCGELRLGWEWAVKGISFMEVH